MRQALSWSSHPAKGRTGGGRQGADCFVVHSARGHTLGSTSRERASSNDIGTSDHLAFPRYLANAPPPTTASASGPTEPSRRPSRRARRSRLSLPNALAMMVGTDSSALAGISASAAGAAGPSRWFGYRLECFAVFISISSPQNCSYVPTVQGDAKTQCNRRLGRINQDSMGDVSRALRCDPEQLDNVPRRTCTSLQWISLIASNR